MCMINTMGTLTRWHSFDPLLGSGFVLPTVLFIWEGEIDAEEDLLEAYAQEADELGNDFEFLGFQERCALCPEQVFR